MVRYKILILFSDKRCFFFFGQFYYFNTFFFCILHQPAQVQLDFRTLA